VDREQLGAALDSKGAAIECVSCGRRPEWSFAEVLLQAAPDAQGDLDIGSGYRTVVMICNHCGFVRMHASQTLF
jgi:uncharacterized Zn finger protein